MGVQESPTGKTYTVLTEGFMSVERKIFGWKCKQAAAWQLLLEHLVNMHEKNNAIYWVLTTQAAGHHQDNYVA